MAYEAAPTPTSPSTRAASILLVGSMIRASTRSRNTLSPLVADSNPSTRYAAHSASHRCGHLRGRGSATARPRRAGDPQVQLRLPGGQPLGGRGLQGRQLGLIVGRAEVLDRARARAATTTRSAPRSPPRRSSRCARRPPRAAYEPAFSAQIPTDADNKPAGQRPDDHAKPRNVSQVRYHKPAPHEFIPFSGGLHRCIGAVMATTEMTVMLARLVSRTRLRLPAQRIRAQHFAALSPRPGLTVEIEAIEAIEAIADSTPAQ